MEETPIQNDTMASYDPQVCFEEDGEATVSWYGNVGSDVMNLFSNRYVPGTGWEGSDNLTPGSNSSYSPRFAVGANRTMLMVFIQHVDGYPTVRSMNRSMDGSWGMPTTIQSGSSASQLARLAVDAEGRGMAVWAQSVDERGEHLLQWI